MISDWWGTDWCPEVTRSHRSGEISARPPDISSLRLQIRGDQHQVRLPDQGEGENPDHQQHGAALQVHQPEGRVRLPVPGHQTGEPQLQPQPLASQSSCELQGPVIWNQADSPYDLPTDLYCVTEVHCRMILQDKTLLTELAEENYDLAIVDLIANECSVALARALGLPVASYWGFGYQGGEVLHTSNLNLPALVPAFMTGYTRNMNFQQRCV